MGWGYGVEPSGREIGYNVPAVCAHPECNEKIDRGLGCACGDTHGAHENCCDEYFCEKHLIYSKHGFVCAECLKLTEEED